MLKTKRLVLRLFRAEDAPAMQRNHAQEELRRWIPNEYYADIDEAKGAAEFFRQCAADGKLPFVLAIEHGRTGELIGDVGLNEVEGSEREIEIGFSVCREWAGQGLATEAVREILHIAKEKFGAECVWGRVLKGNSASQRVLEKCGFRFAGLEENAPDDPYGKGMLVYKLK